MARVLIFTPTYDKLLQERTVESVMALTFDGEFDWVVRDENPYPGRDMRNVVEQFQAGRQMALDGGYDGLLLVEHDMIVPPDGLQKLWDTKAGVVYGTYELRHGMRCLNLFQKTHGRNMGMSLSLYPRELAAARLAKVWEVSGAGFGILLIKREVLERVPFQNGDAAPDLPFAADCLRMGIRQMGRTDVVCGHIDTDSGETLWPFEGGSGMIARVLALQTVTVNDGGQSVAMVRDRYYSITLGTARELVRAGYVRITNEADVVADEMAAEGEGEVKVEGEVEGAISAQAEGREMAMQPTVRKRKPKKNAAA